MSEVTFDKTRTLEEALTLSASDTGCVYFPNDADCIVQGGRIVSGNKKEVKCSLSEYYALRKEGKVDDNTRYYIINIDCDFEATEL